MEHHHHHHINPGAGKSVDSILIICIILNLAFVAVEAAIGFVGNSLGLLSDAGHNLSDAFSLLLSLIAVKLAKAPAHGRYTYGYKKSTILISLVNAVILLTAVGAIVVESIRKFNNPAPVDGALISWTAGAGILVNGFTALMLMSKQKGDLNIKGAFLHMLADTLVSVGVVISGLVIYFTGYSLIDPIVSLVIAAVILVSTWNLLSESVSLSMDAAPRDIDVDEVRRAIDAVEGVGDMHHLHVWAMSTSENALTAHLVIKDGYDETAVKHAVRHALADRGIAHATLETEHEGTRCECGGCCSSE